MLLSYSQTPVLFFRWIPYPSPLTYLGDHLPAGSADGLELGLEALGAHRKPVAFVEFVLDDALLALLAREVLRMPGLIQGL